jgi:hypothetical protein
MLNEEINQNLVEEKDKDFNIIKNQSDKNLIIMLEGDFLYDLLEHNNSKVRLLAAKNIAKLNQIKCLEYL